MNRRAFLAGLVAGAGGLLVPAGLVAPERRIWALGRWAEPDPLDVLMATPNWERFVEAIEAAAERERQHRAWLDAVVASMKVSDDVRYVEHQTFTLDGATWVSAG